MAMARFVVIKHLLLEQHDQTLKALVNVLCCGSRCMWNVEQYCWFWPPLLCAVEYISTLDIITKI